MATTSKNMTFDVNLLPTTTNDHNLGSSSLKWNLYVNQINGSTPTLTDTQVTQSAATTASGAYPILLAYSTATTAVTNTVNKTSTLTYNPNTKALVTGGTVDGYTLAAASAKGVTDNSSNADVSSSDTNLITGRTLYYQLAKKGYTTNTGTVTSITPGNGLINGTSGASQTAITGSGTISIKAAGVTNAMLANSSITIGNATINLGDSVSLDDLGLNYLPLTGGTLTGSLTGTYITSTTYYQTHNDADQYVMNSRKADGATHRGILCLNTNNRFYFRSYVSTNTSSNDGKYEVYQFPYPATSLTANATYDILTTKAAVTVAQGGTGATTFTSGAALIGNGTGAITTRSILNNTSTTYVGTGTDLITKNTLAYWNGAYNSSNASNITKVGTITSGTWNGTKIAKQYVDFYMGGITANDTTITLPVASKTYLIITGHNSTGNYNTMFLYRAGSSTPFWKIWESSASTSSLSGYTMIGNVGWKANNATLTARCATSASINCYAIMLG